MKNPLLLVLTFAGLSVPSTNFFREYHHVKSPKIWAEAQEYCRDVYHDLATIDNHAGNNRLLRAIQDPGKRAWIGLYDDLVRWKWALRHENFNNDEDFSNWKPDEPNNRGSHQSCVIILRNGQWVDKNCGEEHPAVCLNEQGPSKYILVENSMKWYKAMNYCRSNYTDLASVRNKSDNDEIQSLLNPGNPGRSWIGLHRRIWSNWSDRSFLTFTNWNTGQPNNPGSITSCAAVNTTTGKWFDDDCEKRQEFICQALIPPRTRFKLKFQSEADLNDPEIQQQILEQLHAKAKAQGLADFKLRWTEAGGLTFHKEQSKKKKGSGN